ncbi:MAG: hydrogenase 4 subunit F [Thermoplasmata archaeon]|nr:hydrogenase 4 subunit F [Thermoplasmata archaeon]
MRSVRWRARPLSLLAPVSTVVLAVPLAAALLVAISRTRPQANAVVCGAGFASVAAVFLTIREVLNEGTASVPTSLLYVDALSGLLLLLVSLIGLASVLYSVDYMGRSGSPHEAAFPRLRAYYAFVMLFLFTMYLAAEANNLGILWIALEGTTLVSALLVGFYRTRRALEASWKYLILCSVGLSFALFGTLVLYLASVRTAGPIASGLDWTTLVAVGPHLDPGLVSLAVAFLLIGYGTKAGLAPLHTWLPDAHSEAPTPVSALLSGALLNCAMYALLRVDAITLRIPGFTLSHWLFLGFGLVSVFVAAFFILVQQDLKRLMAYHSVEHMGIISVGVGFGGVLGLFGALYHTLNHAATKAALFLAGGNLALSAGTKDLEEVSGALAALPATGAVLLVGGLALAGVPPFSIFSSEFVILSAGFGGGNFVGALLLLVGLAIVFGGLLLHLSRLLLGPQRPRPFAPGMRSAFGAAFGIGLLVAVAVGLGLFLPDPLSQLLWAAARVVTA